jgi:hypothetical protein
MVKKYRNIILNFLAVFLVAGGVLLAGDILVNTSAPDPTNIPITLEDIYQKLNDSNYNSSAHNLYPDVSSTTETMHSLAYIYNAIPPHQTLGNATSTISAGIYEETVLADIEENLLPENIATGTIMFGITGTYECTPPSE